MGSEIGSEGVTVSRAAGGRGAPPPTAAHPAELRARRAGHASVLHTLLGEVRELWGAAGRGWVLEVSASASLSAVSKDPLGNPASCHTPPSGL